MLHLEDLWCPLVSSIIINYELRLNEVIYVKFKRLKAEISLLVCHSNKAWRGAGSRLVSFYIFFLNLGVNLISVVMRDWNSFSSNRKYFFVFYFNGSLLSIHRSHKDNLVSKIKEGDKACGTKSFVLILNPDLESATYHGCKEFLAYFFTCGLSAHHLDKKYNIRPVKNYQQLFTNSNYGFILNFTISARQWRAWSYYLLCSALCRLKEPA